MKSPIRWGIIGCGDVTEVKSGPALQRAEGSALVAVMRRDGAKAADYAKRHNVARWYDNADKLIDDPDVDAVYVATPPDTHEHYAMRVLLRGKPCYVEKPMGRNFAECARMVEGFKAKNVPLFVAYYRRGLPRFLKAKELVESGKLGTISSVSLRYSGWRWKDEGNPWRLNAESAGAGHFMDLASHTLDGVDFIVGPLESVSGFAVNVASNCAVEDNIAMSFRIGKNVLGTGFWNFAAGVWDDTIEITGTLGRVSLSTFGNEPVKFTAGEKEQELFELPNPPHIQQPHIQTVVNDLLGKGKCSCTGEMAARTNKVMDTVLNGYYGGREDGFWKRSWPGKRI